MIRSLAILFFLAYFLTPRVVLASSDVLLNEIVVDQSPQAVELLNGSSDNIDISGWFLDDNGGTSFFTVPNNIVIYAHSCIVFSSEFNLNKSSPDIARLFDATAPPTSPASHLLDSYSYTAGPGGLSSFSRVPDGESWSTASASLGKLNSSGESCVIIPTASPTPSSIPTATVSFAPTPSSLPQNTLPTPSLSAISNVHLSEVMVNPEVGEKEWIELYNDNDFDVNLTNWYIDDVENEGSAPKQFSLTIPAKRYAVYMLSSGIFNNDADSVRLLDSNKQEVDSFEYSTSEKGKSIGRVDFSSDTFCDQTPSKGTLNNECSLMDSLESDSSPVILSADTSSPSEAFQMRIPSPSTGELQSVPTPFQEKIDYSSIFHVVQEKVAPKDSTKFKTVVLSQSITRKNVYLSALLKVLPLISGIFPIFSVVSLLLKRTVLK